MDSFHVCHIWYPFQCVSTNIITLKTWRMIPTFCNKHSVVSNFPIGISFYCMFSGGKSSHKIHGTGYCGNRIAAIRCN